ncbi:MAG: VWA domain-containing protein [Candidatus Hydrogenedentes bacterium]|nr:VWA domain-containing protein [Candidatus Hydrogenedentota bacterium]
MNAGFIFPLRQLHWWLGLALAIVALVAFGLALLERRRKQRLACFADANLAPRLALGAEAPLRRPLHWFTMLGVVALAVTFAQPHWGQSWQNIQRRSHDVLVVLDTSESMRAINPPPSRLERAKQKIIALLERESADRFGLVAFAGGAALQCPLTRDHGYFHAVLKAVDTDTISEKGTNIAAALKEAAKTFKDEDEHTDDFNRDARAILLISDGDEADAENAEKAKERIVEAAKEAGKYAHIYVIGVGDPNGVEIKFPEDLERYVQVRDADRTHLSKLDEETLTKIALEGNGGYTRSTPDNSDIDQLTDLIAKLATRDVGSDVRLRLVNRYQWPLGLAILCFAAEGLWLTVLPILRARRTRQPQTSRERQEEAHAKV